MPFPITAQALSQYLGSYPGSRNGLWATDNPALPFAQWRLIAVTGRDVIGI